VQQAKQKGDNNMRRQVEHTTKDRLAVIALTIFWIIALTALSASAHGLENTPSAAGNIPKTQTPESRLASDNPIAARPRPSTEAGPNSGDASSEAKTQTVDRFILVSIPDRRLALIDHGVVVKTWEIAVGADETPSPTGDYTIVSRVTDPVYYHEGKTVLPGKANPVGSRWMGLSLKGYGIHGTNRQSSVGKAVSHGCFRLKKKDVEELFSLVKIGDVVTIRGERDELVATVFGSDTRIAAGL
jgi:lipoprotein-anchoring transpeptidase ErfK/SrfK